MDHDGVMRFSEEAFSDVMRSGTSAMFTRLTAIRRQYGYGAT
jgi:hypothetical protein